MAQQTAVEWLAKNLKDFPHIKHSQSFKELIEQAKQMEKDQIMNAFLEGKVNHSKDWAEEYYNRHYGKERDHSKESTCEYSGLRSVQSYEDPKK